MGQRPSEEELFSMINDVDESNSGKISFYEFIKVYENHQRDSGEDNEQDLSKVYIVDAFVAMGGNPDGSGSIDTNRLIQVVRDQFQMTINIEKLIEEIKDENTHSIDFDEFKSLLTS